MAWTQTDLDELKALAKSNTAKEIAGKLGRTEGSVSAKAGEMHVSLGGGGKLDYARVREAVERTAVAAGWTFHLEGGRMP